MNPFKVASLPLPKASLLLSTTAAARGGADAQVRLGEDLDPVIDVPLPRGDGLADQLFAVRMVVVRAWPYPFPAGFRYMIAKPDWST
ncbi:hypothetical protein, partial [Streptomyces wuyuanensis]|uniref:hypothetical protein n=1 Tax=Streptomyces wuyuanensis TaxID=1196353 RepID=UPI003D765CDF